MAKEVKWLLKDIEQWFEAQPEDEKEYSDSFDLFWEHIYGSEVLLPSGKIANYEESSSDGDVSLAIFSVDSDFYALKGWENSWGSELDSGPFLVEKRQVTVERWITL